MVPLAEEPGHKVSWQGKITDFRAELQFVLQHAYMETNSFDKKEEGKRERHIYVK